MKKFVLAAVGVSSLAFVVNAEKYLTVKDKEGKFSQIEVAKIKNIEFLEAEEAKLVDGVSVSGKVGDYNYVDLGLSSGLKWAVCNVGAQKPSQSGSYISWGETESKDSYYEHTYKWYDYNDTYDYTKYILYSHKNIVDGKSVLEADDDVASVRMGEDWRMPTDEEYEELIAGCNWQWTNDFKGTGVKGNVGTSKINGNFIFFPACGEYNYDFLSGHDGNYWTSSVDPDYYGSNARIFAFDGDKTGIYSSHRVFGLPARGVSGPRVVSKKYYVVTYYKADSTIILSQSVEEGGSVICSNAPQLNGYDFVGWSDSSFTDVHSDLNIYAQYEVEYIPDGVTVSGKVAGYEYVDLGLKSGTLWATCNVGTEDPFSYGDFFAWGETTVKSSYVSSNYKKEGKYSVAAGDTVLVAEDDAATVNWGDKWRTPTHEEFVELANGCVWKIAEDFGGKGIAGMVGISKTNKNVIFLPFSGYAKAVVEREGTAATYWTSTLGYDGTYAYSAATYFASISNSFRFVQVNWGSQDMGRNVRGVVNK